MWLHNVLNLAKISFWEPQANSGIQNNSLHAFSSLFSGIPRGIDSCCQALFKITIVLCEKLVFGNWSYKLFKIPNMIDSWWLNLHFLPTPYPFTNFPAFLLIFFCLLLFSSPCYSLDPSTILLALHYILGFIRYLFSTRTVE